MMRKGFTLIEVLLAALLLGVGLSTILVSMSQAQKLMLLTVSSEAAHEVMDLGEMAYPLEEVTDIDDIDIAETKVEELWSMISEERLTNEQEEKFYGYTWKRERVDENMNSDEIARLGGICPVRITVKWDDNRRGDHKEESYITFWRQPAE